MKNPGANCKNNADLWTELAFLKICLDGFGNSEAELYNMLKCVEAYTERLIKASLSYVPCFTDTDTLIHAQPYNNCTHSYIHNNIHVRIIKINTLTYTCTDRQIGMHECACSHARTHTHTHKQLFPLHCFISLRNKMRHKVAISSAVLKLLGNIYIKRYR